MNVIEFHPWGSKVKTLEKPDRLIFDLDPDPGIGWPKIKAAARELRDALEDDSGLHSFPRLSGGKGVHLVVPIAKRYTWDQCARLLRSLRARDGSTRAAALRRHDEQGQARRAHLHRLVAQRARRDRGVELLAARAPRRAGRDAGDVG